MWYVKLIENNRYLRPYNQFRWLVRGLVTNQLSLLIQSAVSLPPVWLVVFFVGIAEYYYIGVTKLYDTGEFHGNFWTVFINLSFNVNVIEIVTNRVPCRVFAH